MRDDTLPDDATVVRPATAQRAAVAPGGHAGEPAADDATVVRPPTGAALSWRTASQPSTGGTARHRPQAAGAGSTLTGITTHGPAQADGEGVVRQMGRYEIRSRLGRGGMASVYLAHDPDIGRDVAIKFLHASLAEDEECRVRFLREARAAGGLSHPNSVTVHDVGELEGRPYMAMELIQGDTLADVLARTPKLPMRDVALIGAQVARVLGYAHGRGIVHRDIKPGNIMVLADGQTVKVTDFGIAHMDDGGQQRTQVGAVLGTPQYMSPEQTRGDALDGRSDVFSLGIVLYQMLTGERPFRGDNLVAVATRIATEPHAPLESLRPKTPAAMRRIVDRCLAKAPAQRVQSADELAQALEQVVAEIDDKARRGEAKRIIPLRVRWALMMGAITMTVMGIATVIMAQRQYAVAMGQAVSYGSSLARFIAYQHAGNALAEDWGVIDASVQEMMKSGNFDRIEVMDAAGIVRVSSRPALLDKPFHRIATEPLSVAVPQGTQAGRYVVAGEPMLGFERPILYTNQAVGSVALGIPEKPLTQVVRLSIMLMAAFAVVATLAATVPMYLLAKRFGLLLRVARTAVRELTQGHWVYRIGRRRKDEFGQLFDAIDAMADSVERRMIELPPAAAPMPPAPSTPAAAPQLPAEGSDADALPDTLLQAPAGPEATSPRAS